MSWFQRLFCRHTSVTLHRSHRNVVTPAHVPFLAWVDYLRCHNFLRCTKCGASIKFNRNYSRVYGEPEL